MAEALVLSEDERERYDRGVCLCGCGRPVKTRMDYCLKRRVPVNMYDAPACKQRLFRARRKQGRCIPAADRADLRDRMQSMAVIRTALKVVGGSVFMLMQDADTQTSMLVKELARLDYKPMLEPNETDLKFADALKVRADSLARMGDLCKRSAARMHEASGRVVEASRQLNLHEQPGSTTSSSRSARGKAAKKASTGTGASPN